MAQIIHNVSFPNDNLGDPLRTAFIHQNEMNTELYETKVDKITGQGLSENNFTDAEQTKLAGIEEGAQVNVQSDWLQEDNTADDFIKNKPELNSIAAYPDTKYPYVDSLDFTIPDNVQAISVRKNGTPTETETDDWTQTANVITYLGTMEVGDFLIISGVYVIASSEQEGASDTIARTLDITLDQLGISSEDEITFELIATYINSLGLYKSEKEFYIVRITESFLEIFDLTSEITTSSLLITDLT